MLFLLYFITIFQIIQILKIVRQIVDVIMLWVDVVLSASKQRKDTTNVNK